MPKTKKMLALEKGGVAYVNFWDEKDNSLGVWVTLDGMFDAPVLKKILEALEEVADAQ